MKGRAWHRQGRLSLGAMSRWSWAGQAGGPAKGGRKSSPTRQAWWQVHGHGSSVPGGWQAGRWEQVVGRRQCKVI